MGRVMRVLLVVIVCLFLLMVGPAAAAPAAAEATEAPGLVEVLGMLAQGIGVGAVIAFLMEKFGWFQALKPESKWWVILGISMGLPILAEIALQFVPADTWALLEPYWRAIASGFLAWAGSQGVHLVQKALVARSW